MYIYSRLKRTITLEYFICVILEWMLRWARRWAESTGDDNFLFIMGYKKQTSLVWPYGQRRRNRNITCRNWPHFLFIEYMQQNIFNSFSFCYSKKCIKQNNTNSVTKLPVNKSLPVQKSGQISYQTRKQTPVSPPNRGFGWDILWFTALLCWVSFGFTVLYFGQYDEMVFFLLQYITTVWIVSRIGFIRNWTHILVQCYTAITKSSR